MAQVRSAVVAGSKGFVDAVQGHIKARFGTAPRVASDPVEALRACADEGGLLVLEYAGIRWLEAVKSLRGTCGDAGLSIVAAVPLAQASDVQPLQRAGVDEVVSWQGRVDPVIWAVERIVDRQNAKQNDAQLSAPDSPSGEEIETGFEIREISSTDVHASEGVRPDAANPAPPTVPLPSRADARTTPTGSPEAWPDAVPSAAVAEALLLAMSAGRPLGDGGQLAAAERVLSAASELERAAFAAASTSRSPRSPLATTGRTFQPRSSWLLKSTGRSTGSRRSPQPRPPASRLRWSRCGSSSSKVESSSRGS